AREQRQYQNKIDKRLSNLEDRITNLEVDLGRLRNVQHSQHIHTREDIDALALVLDEIKSSTQDFHQHPGRQPVLKRGGKPSGVKNQLTMMKKKFMTQRKLDQYHDHSNGYASQGLLTGLEGNSLSQPVMLTDS